MTKHRPRLALIPPIEMLEYTDLTRVQLMLPHLVAESAAYEYTYQRHCQDSRQFVILDNGAAEGVTFPSSGLLDMALSFGVDEVVIPDTIKDIDATISKADRFLQEAFLLREPILPRFMFVIQGKNVAEFKEAILWASRLVSIDTIGIPRHAIQTCDDFNVRGKLADYAMELAPGKSVHLLGTSGKNITELRDIKWPQNVRSVDTSAPFNYAYELKYIRKGTDIRRPPGYFHMPFETFSESHVDSNVNWLRLYTR
jgi:hypothetical protein